VALVPTACGSLIFHSSILAAVVYVLPSECVGLAQRFKCGYVDEDYKDKGLKDRA